MSDETGDKYRTQRFTPNPASQLDANMQTEDKPNAIFVGSTKTQVVLVQNGKVLTFSDEQQADEVYKLIKEQYHFLRSTK